MGIPRMLPIWYDHFIAFSSPVLFLSDWGAAEDIPRFHALGLGNAAA
jgi:hypothetical protein